MLEVCKVADTNGSQGFEYNWIGIECLNHSKLIGMGGVGIHLLEGLFRQIST
jgi:hypothetical protein